MVMDKNGLPHRYAGGLGDYAFESESPSFSDVRLEWSTGSYVPWKPSLGDRISDAVYVHGLDVLVPLIAGAVLVGASKLMRHNERVTSPVLSQIESDAEGLRSGIRADVEATRRMKR